jgi:hypothetical protein
MTAPSTPDAEAQRTASGLSLAQQDWLRNMRLLPANPLYRERLHRYAPDRGRLQSALALWRRGLVDSTEDAQPDAWEQGGMGFVRLTPFGLRVRAALSLARNGEEGK